MAAGAAQLVASRLLPGTNSRDIAPHAHSNKRNEDPQRREAGRGARADTKDARDEAGEIKGPAAANDVDQDAPRKGADGEPDSKGGGQEADVEVCAGGRR